MRHVISGSASAACAVFMITGCYYDNYEDLYQYLPDDCDTASVSWSLDIKPWVDNTCIICHDGVFQAPDLRTYEAVKANAQTMLNRISLEEGNPSLMPQGGPKLDQCKIDKFDIWIQMGSPEN